MHTPTVGRSSSRARTFLGGCALALAMTSMLAGCATRGQTADAERPDPRPLVGAITLCTTTETELRRDFGTPTRDGRLRDARILSWITAMGDDGVAHYLAVMLDARGRVVDLYWDLPTEIPWTPADQCSGR